MSVAAFPTIGRNAVLELFANRMFVVVNKWTVIQHHAMMPLQQCNVEDVYRTIIVLHYYLNTFEYFSPLYLFRSIHQLILIKVVFIC